MLAIGSHAIKGLSSDQGPLSRAYVASATLLRNSSPNAPSSPRNTSRAWSAVSWPHVRLTLRSGDRAGCDDGRSPCAFEQAWPITASR